MWAQRTCEFGLSGSKVEALGNPSSKQKHGKESARPKCNLIFLLDFCPRAVMHVVSLPKKVFRQPAPGLCVAFEGELHWKGEKVCAYA